jgi:[acyl-carrier-protein] S-malonyltransferase
MQKHVKHLPLMAAVLDLADNIVEEVCASIDGVVAANYNRQDN